MNRNFQLGASTEFEKVVFSLSFICH